MDPSKPITLDKVGGSVGGPIEKQPSARLGRGPGRVALQLVSLPNFKVVEVVGGCDFQRPGPEPGLLQAVEEVWQDLQD